MKRIEEDLGSSEPGATPAVPLPPESNKGKWLAIGLGVIALLTVIGVSIYRGH